MKLKLFKSITKIEGCKEEFVDWYSAADEAGARAQWLAECQVNGLPMAKTTVRFIECDPKTHKDLCAA